VAGTYVAFEDLIFPYSEFNYFAGVGIMIYRRKRQAAVLA
jgi:hypothetical protein